MNNMRCVAVRWWHFFCLCGEASEYHSKWRPVAGVRPRRKEGERGNKDRCRKWCQVELSVFDLRFFKEQLRVEV